MVDQRVSQPDAHTVTATEESTGHANELRSRLARSSQKVEELTELLQKRDTELEVLRREIDHLRQEHARVLGSASWRVTSPLRKLRGGV